MTDTEIAHAIAEKVMGWNPSLLKNKLDAHGYCWVDECRCNSKYDPANNLYDVFGPGGVVDMMGKKGYRCLIKIAPGGQSLVIFGLPLPDMEHATSANGKAEDPIITRAVCLAALAAIGG
jgi:hypothetical protein